MSRSVTITKHLSRDELEEHYKKEGDPRVKERLLAILNIYDGKTIGQTSEIVRRGEASIKRWIKSWNERGYDGLVPQFDGGPKPRVTDSEWDRIIKEIENKGMTLRDVAVYVKNTRGVEYKYSTVWKVLRKQKRVRYGKAYKMNRKRPENAEEILKKGSMKRSQRPTTGMTR